MYRNIESQCCVTRIHMVLYRSIILQRQTHKQLIAKEIRLVVPRS